MRAEEAEAEERVEEAPEESNGLGMYLDPRDRRVFGEAPVGARLARPCPGPADLGF